MSWIVKVGKQGKKIVKKLITPAEKHYVGYTRRIERVHTTRRICAMTFDDGPMGLPASPDRFDGRTLTDVLLDTLAQYGARGSFDVIGDTSENYPDEAGKLGSARAAHNAAATDNICHWYCTSKCILQIYCPPCYEKSNKNRWLVLGNFYQGAQFS